MTIDLTSLNWSDRFELINQYELTDDQVLDTFDVSDDEYNTAKELLSNQTIMPNPTVEVLEYKEFFGKDPIKNPTNKNADKSASKIIRPPKKRGKKGDKIVKAFESIGTTPVEVQTVMDTYKVSLAVLRQSKRFDPTNLGTVHVKQDKETSKLVIWRDEPKTEE